MDWYDRGTRDRERGDLAEAERCYERAAGPTTAPGPGRRKRD